MISEDKADAGAMNNSELKSHSELSASKYFIWIFSALFYIFEYFNIVFGIWILPSKQIWIFLASQSVVSVQDF